MTTHVLIVARDEEYIARFGDHPDDPARTYTLECSDRAACPGWYECFGDHTGAPDPDEGDDEAVLHGEPHTYMWGHGWTIAHPGCPAEEAYADGDSHLEIGRTHGLGRHEVEVDWDDTDCHLIAIAEPA